MKRINKLPNEIKNKILTEHQKALSKMLDEKVAVVLPIHTANMNIIENGVETIRKTIIPPLAVYVGDFVVGGKVKSREIKYNILYNKKPLPIAHIYRASGHLCLGSIFVPQFIPAHSPQQPLETLLLHNDRNTSHGNPQLPISEEQRNDLEEIRKTYLPDHKIDFEANWVLNDTLWLMGSYLLETHDKETAFKIMDDVFKIVFKD